MGCPSRRLLPARVCLLAPELASFPCLEVPVISRDVGGKRLEVGFQRDWIIAEVLAKSVGDNFP